MDCGGGPVISMVLDLGPSRAAGGFHYRVAGQSLVADQVVASLSAFEAQALAEAELSTTSLPSEGEVARLTFEGSAWLGGEERWVECRQGHEGYEIRIAPGLVWRVAADGSAIRFETRSQPIPRSLVEEIAVGPPLILALGLRGVFCLHASAVVGPQGVFAFLGVSGSGKSTLAAALDGRRSSAGESGGTYFRLADDILPVALEPSGPAALPRFPQLKLAASTQPSLGFAERLPLAGLYVLGGQESTWHVESRRLGGAEAVAALIRHTVAARLFAPDLLSRHLGLTGELAARLPVERLTYPWSRDIWDELAARLLVRGA